MLGWMIRLRAARSISEMAALSASPAASWLSARRTLRIAWRSRERCCRLRSARMALVRTRFSADLTFGKLTSGKIVHGARSAATRSESAKLAGRQAAVKRRSSAILTRAEGLASLRPMENFENLLISLPVLIFSVVCHEVAHGWVARREGDNTAYMLGRITLNPVPHLDPVGSILVPGMLAFLGSGFLFGWARPVPVNPRNFHNYRRGDIRVSLAGVVVNLILAVIFSLLLLLTYLVWQVTPELASTWRLVERMFFFGVGINLILAFFNLIPIPPLDGSHVLYHFLPPGMGMRLRDLSRYGMIPVIAFLFLGGFRLIQYPVAMIMAVLVGLARGIAGV